MFFVNSRNTVSICREQRKIGTDFIDIIDKNMFNCLKVGHCPVKGRKKDGRRTEKILRKDPEKWRLPRKNS